MPDAALRRGLRGGSYGMVCLRRDLPEAEVSGGQNPSRLDVLDEAGGRHETLYRSCG